MQYSLSAIKKAYELRKANDIEGYIDVLKEIEPNYWYVFADFMTYACHCDLSLNQVRAILMFSGYEEIDDRELVRCKECKFYQTNYLSGLKQCSRVDSYIPYGKDDDYCSLGEKK